MSRMAILLIGLLTDFRRYLAAGQWLAPEMGFYCFCHADFADDADFFSLIILVPQISQMLTDFRPVRSGMTQILDLFGLDDADI